MEAGAEESEEQLTALVFPEGWGVLILGLRAVTWALLSLESGCLMVLWFVLI